jgi:cytochrome P450
MAFIYIILLVISALVFSWPYKLYRNYLIARRTGLSLIISPITPFTLSWHILPALFPSFIKRQRWYRALDQTCAWQDKNKIHAELGTCFMHVSPDMNMLCTSDSVAIDNVFKKMNDFIKPEVFKTLDFFGPNIITVNHDPWVRHRKLTAPCFNERISTFVWDESRRQANDMLEDWLAKPNCKSNTVVQDSGTVALHVITAAAFGSQRDFRQGVNELPANHSLSFRDSLRGVLKHPVTAAVVVGMPWLKSPIMQKVLSKKIRGVQLALAEFKNYMLEAITRERQSAKFKTDTASDKRPNLLNTLVKASDEEKLDGVSKMSDGELTGNMFMFAFAGHETTANTIIYALAHLAVHQDVQDWVAEELVEVVGKAGSKDYTKIQPRLKRTLALMYETVRLFGVPPPWRDIAIGCEEPQFIDSSGVVMVPANTQVSLNVYACHTAPENWMDGERWNPRRWIKEGSEGDGEQLMSSSKAFFGWGNGPRVCPGQSEYGASIPSCSTDIRCRICTCRVHSGSCYYPNRVSNSACGKRRLKRS